MGLLDAILGGVMGGRPGSDGGTIGQPNARTQNPLLLMVLQLLQRNGGLEGSLGKLQQAGYGLQAPSGVGPGRNPPRRPRVVLPVFGPGPHRPVAREPGI